MTHRYFQNVRAPTTPTADRPENPAVLHAQHSRWYLERTLVYSCRLKTICLSLSWSKLDHIPKPPIFHPWASVMVILFSRILYENTMQTLKKWNIRDTISLRSKTETRSMLWIHHRLVYGLLKGGLKTKIQFSFLLLFCVDKTLEEIWRQDLDNTVKEFWNEVVSSIKSCPTVFLIICVSSISLKKSGGNLWT